MPRTSPSGLLSRGTESSQTHRWREMDSNHRFLVRRSRFLLRKANCGGSNGGGLLKLFLCGVPMVRIHLPPPASLLRTAIEAKRIRLQPWEVPECSNGVVLLNSHSATETGSLSEPAVRNSCSPPPAIKQQVSRLSCARIFMAKASVAGIGALHSAGVSAGKPLKQ
jgi:hypothetical protein